jgi:hypothetical protein
MSGFMINRISGMGHSPVSGVPQKRQEVAHSTSRSMSGDVGFGVTHSENSGEPIIGENVLERNLGTQFEAMFLRQVLETMLPSNASAVFGKGTAGDAWRSMLADNLSMALAERDFLGLSGAAGLQPGHTHESASG